MWLSSNKISHGSGKYAPVPVNDNSSTESDSDHAMNEPQEREGRSFCYCILICSILSLSFFLARSKIYEQSTLYINPSSSNPTISPTILETHPHIVTDISTASSHISTDLSTDSPHIPSTESKDTQTNLLIISSLLNDTFTKHNGIVDSWLMSIQKAFVDKEVRVTIIVLVNFDIKKTSSVDGLEVRFIFISTLVYQTDLYRFDLLPILEDNSNSNYVLFTEMRDFKFISSPFSEFKDSGKKAWVGSEEVDESSIARFDGKLKILHRKCAPHEKLPNWIENSNNPMIHLNFYLGEMKMYLELIKYLESNLERAKKSFDTECGLYYGLNFFMNDQIENDVRWMSKSELSKFLEPVRPYNCDMFGEVQFQSVLRSYVVSDDGNMISIKYNAWADGYEQRQQTLYPHEKAKCIFCELDNCVKVKPTLSTSGEVRWIHCNIPDFIKGRLDDHYLTPFQLTLHVPDQKYTDESVGLCLHDRIYETYSPPPWDTESANICTWTGCSGSSNVYGECAKRADNIKQWLHIMQFNGVRQIYLYDTSRTYNNSLRPHLHDFIVDGFLTYIFSPVGPDIDKTHSYNDHGVRRNPYQLYYQADRSADCTYRFQNRSRFIMYMDSDELPIVTERDSTGRPYNLSYMIGTHIQQFPITNSRYGKNVGEYETYNRRTLTRRRLAADRTYGLLLNQIWPCRWDLEKRGNFLEWYRCGFTRTKSDHKTIYESGNGLASYIHHAHYTNNWATGNWRKPDEIFMLDTMHGICVLHVRAGNEICGKPAGCAALVGSLPTMLPEFRGYADWITPYVKHVRETFGGGNEPVHGLFVRDVEEVLKLEENEYRNFQTRNQTYLAELLVNLQQIAKEESSISTSEDL